MLPVVKMTLATERYPNYLLYLWLNLSYSTSGSIYSLQSRQLFHYQDRIEPPDRVRSDQNLDKHSDIR